MLGEYRTLRTLALLVGGVAGWALAVGLLWSQAERNHHQRRQIRLLMIAETAARSERDQLTQAHGTLADLQTRLSAGLGELTSLSEVRARSASQVAELERAAEIQSRRAKDAAASGDELLGHIWQLERRLGEAVEQVRRRQAELASLQDAVAAEARQVAQFRQGAQEARNAERMLEEELVTKRSELQAVELRLESARAEGRELANKAAGNQQLDPAPLDPELRATR